MGMKRYKITLLSGLLIGAVVMGAFLFIDREENSVSLINGGAEMRLTEEQYQLLESSINSESFEQMNDIKRKNAWLFLNAMAEIGFVEGRYPGQSRVGLATRILELLGVGEIQELEIVNYENDIYDPDRGTYGVNGYFIARIVGENDLIYYVHYFQTGGIGIVFKDRDNGEIIYNRALHTIIDGRLCKREYPRGPAIDCE